MKLLKENKIKVKELVTSEYPLEDVKEAFEASTSSILLFLTSTFSMRCSRKEKDL